MRPQWRFRSGPSPIAASPCCARSLGRSCTARQKYGASLALRRLGADWHHDVGLGGRVNDALDRPRQGIEGMTLFFEIREPVVNASNAAQRMSEDHLGNV